MLFLLWLCLFILSGVISPLISSSTLGTYWTEEFIFQCPIFLPFYSSWGSQGRNTEVVYCSLLHLTTFCQNSPPWPVLSWVALHGMAHSFIKLDKAVVHVIKLRTTYRIQKQRSRESSLLKQRIKPERVAALRDTRNLSLGFQQSHKSRRTKPAYAAVGCLWMRFHSNPCLVETLWERWPHILAYPGHSWFIPVVSVLLLIVLASLTSIPRLGHEWHCSSTEGLFSGRMGKEREKASSFRQSNWEMLKNKENIHFDLDYGKRDLCVYLLSHVQLLWAHRL